MKAYTSVLSTDDLIRLCRETLGGDTLRNLNSLARSHELYFSDPYHTKGGTPNWNRQEIIELFASAHGGTSPDDFVRARDAANPAPPKPTHAPPTRSTVVKVTDGAQQAPPAQHPLTALLVPCNGGCGIDVAITLGKYQQGGNAAYCPKCLKQTDAQNTTTVNAIQQFVKEVPSFYPHPANLQVLGDEIERRGHKFATIDVITEVYALVRNQMPFKRLTEAEGRAMTSAEWEARAKGDAGMGGLNLDAVKEGLNRGTQTVHSSNKTKTFDLPLRGYTGGGR